MQNDMVGCQLIDVVGDVVHGRKMGRIKVVAGQQHAVGILPGGVDRCGFCRHVDAAVLRCLQVQKQVAREVEKFPAVLGAPHVLDDELHGRVARLDAIEHRCAVRGLREEPCRCQRDEHPSTYCHSQTSATAPPGPVKGARRPRGRKLLVSGS